MTDDPVAELLADPRFKGSPITWEITPEGYDTIRRTWLTHVQAEEVLFKPFTEEVFQAQMEIMLGVFTEDCVMELVQSGQRWQGREQAAAFYRVFLNSILEMEWVPQALVIGPQGVLDVVNMTRDSRETLRRPHRGRRGCAPAMGDFIPVGAGSGQVQGRDDLLDPAPVALPFNGRMTSVK